MKKLFCCLLLFLLAFAARAADLKHAEELYRQGKYAAALGEYEELLKTYPNDPHLYYNIGNSYFKMGSRGLAAANYYRAFRLAPRDADIRHNLSLALESGGERLVPAGMPAVLHKAFFWLTPDELKGLCFLLLWLTCTLGAVWLVRRRFGAVALTAAAILLVLAVWYGARYRIAREQLAVVAAPVAEIRSGPGPNFPASANAAQGHLVLLRDLKDNWYEVVVKSQGIEGWAEADALEKI